MVKVIVEEGESIDSALKRFKKACNKEGIQDEIRRRTAFESKTIRKKNRKNELKRKAQKKAALEEDS